MADDGKFTQADIDAAVASAVGPLKSKIDEALDEAKDAKRKLRNASEIKPEDLTAAEDRADKAEARAKELEKTAKDATTAKDKAETALKSEQGVTHKLIVENGLREQLAANGVTDPIYQKAAMAMLSGQVQIAADGDTRVAKVGDKVLTDFVKEWAGGEEGKRLVSAPVNSGGSAPGARPTVATGQTMTRSHYDGLDQTAKGEAGLRMGKGELKLVDDTA